MKRAIRKAGALGVVMGILAGMFVPGFAHANEFVVPRNLQVERVSETTVSISWDRPKIYENVFDDRTGRYPRTGPGLYYWVTLHTNPIPTSRWSYTAGWRNPHGSMNQCRDRFRYGDRGNGAPVSQSPPLGCIRRDLTLIRRAPFDFAPYHRYPRESVVVSGLTPETNYYVHVAQAHFNMISCSFSHGCIYGYKVSTGVTARIAAESTPEPETPTEPEPETPTTPETPDPTPQEPAAPQNLRVEGVAGSTHNAVTVSWETGRAHTGNIPRVSITGHHITLFTSLLSDSTIREGFTPAGICIRRYRTQPAGCIRRNVPLSNGNRYSETISGLIPETTYYVAVAATVHDGHKHIGSWRAYESFTTTAAPETPTEPEPETPTEPEPETPTTPEPETPDPSTPDCTYEHRLIGVPATTGAGYTSQILISSKDSKATVKLRAYQAFNGAPIDVLNSDDQAVGSTTSLSPANSVKVFRLEDARGWHTVIVEHPSKAAMDNATVAMRLREPDTGVSIELAERIEQCTNTATTTETPSPDLVIRNTQAVLWPQTFDWFASVVNIGDAVAERTTLRVYHGDREIDTKAVESEIAAGSEWRMSDFIRSNRPSVGDMVRICVDPVSGEAAQDRPNNCSSATVERN